MAAVVDTFRAFGGILVICPCCGEILRLSELNLRYTGRFERTIIDEIRARERGLERREQSLARRVERFDEREQALRDAAAREGRKAARRVVRKIDPAISRLSFDPQDIKTVAHPVDLVVFDGMSRGERIRRVVLVARRKRGELAALRRSIDRALSRGRCGWETARVCADGSLEIERA